MAAMHGGLSQRHRRLVARPGQFVFLNVPEVSALQWHPFTAVPSSILPPIVDKEGDGGHDDDDDDTYAAAKPTMSVFVKSMGKGTWTNELCDYVRRLQQVQQQQQQQLLSEKQKQEQQQEQQEEEEQQQQEQQEEE